MSEETKDAKAAEPKMVEHVVTEADVAANPGEDLTVGETIMIPAPESEETVKEKEPKAEVKKKTKKKDKAPSKPKAKSKTPAKKASTPKKPKPYGGLKTKSVKVNGKTRKFSPKKIVKNRRG